MRPKISIIIPIYNARKYLNKCIESIMNQSYSNLEIILVNDGSTDNSLEICNKYKDMDTRIIVINKKNNGVSAARNSGLEICSGNFIGFVDSDDYVDAEMYEVLMNASLKYDADIVECGHYEVDNNYNIVRINELEDDFIVGSYDCSYNYLLGKNSKNFNWNKLYKRELFNNVKYPALSYSEDFLVNVKTHCECKKKSIISGCYYYYLQNSEGASRSKFNPKKFDMVEAGRLAIQYMKNRHENLIPFIITYILSHLITMYKELKNSKISEVIKYRKEILRDYIYYYKMAKKISMRIRIKYRIFRLSPIIYQYVEKIYSFALANKKRNRV